MLFKMKTIFLLSVTYVLYVKCVTNALTLPGPHVYIVTPAPKSPQIDEGRSAPFYYNNWMKRIDSPTTTTTTPKSETHDLIFAEFESENGVNTRKSIHKLLDKEKIYTITTSTTSKPNIMQEERKVEQMSDTHFTKPIVVYDENVNEENESGMKDYFAMYNNLYSSAPAPVYLPSTTERTTSTPIIESTKSTPTSNNMDIKNIWHIIDNQKYNEYSSGKWEEQDIILQDNKDVENKKSKFNTSQDNQDHQYVNENFALSGFDNSPDNKSENESRAIRTDANYQFPYVNLKTIQMKKPLLTMYNKKGNNMYSNLDNFQDVKFPVRGEAQDFIPHNAPPINAPPINAPIDRYNSAQPYLPTKLGNKSKQSSYSSKPVKTVANLVPPPPPPLPPPRTEGDYLPPPVTYESFPPYPPARPAAPISPPVDSQIPDNDPSSIYQTSNLSDDSNDSPPSDTDDSDSPPPGYRYKPPVSHFAPTLPPTTIMKPFTGYTYEKPPPDDEEPPMDTNTKYNEPAPIMPMEDHNPPSYGSYGNHDHHHSHDTDDYPELIYNKPHGDNSDDMKDGDDMAPSNDMGMVPPPPPQEKPHMDHGFPHDFPGDFKYHDDFEDFYHDHHHHHHHTTTTTTTTTEMPRVNRYSYYYLGKKLYYIPLYFSVYFIVYVGALVIKAVLRHKIVYPSSWRPNDVSGSFFSKRSVDNNDTWDFSGEKLHEVTRLVTSALTNAAEKYINNNK